MELERAMLHADDPETPSPEITPLEVEILTLLLALSEPGPVEDSS